MAKAKKTDSGRWKVRVYSHTDSDGKKHYKAFTADTKKEAELMALEFTEKSDNMTFKQAIDSYIESRSSVIAPSTLKEYKRSALKDFDMLLDKDIKKINQEDIQRQINEHAKTKSAKTVKNIHGLISAVMKMYRPGFILQTTLPQKDVKEIYIPTDDDIKTILAYAKENDKEMYIAILLAAFAPLRRSEICGLTSDDFNKNVIHVQRAIVNSDEGWTKKKTKTSAGDRYIPLPGFVYDEIRHIKGNVVQLKPNMISDRFIDIVVRCKLNHFTFHSLRHYCASYLHTIGMPDIYIMERCGWDSDIALKKIYRHALADQSSKINDEANKKFAEVFGCMT